MIKAVGVSSAEYCTLSIRYIYIYIGISNQSKEWTVTNCCKRFLLLDISALSCLMKCLCTPCLNTDIGSVDTCAMAVHLCVSDRLMICAAFTTSLTQSQLGSYCIVYTVCILYMQNNCRIIITSKDIEETMNEYVEELPKSHLQVSFNP